MKKANKILSLVLIVALFLGTVNVHAFSQQVVNPIEQRVNEEQQFAKEAYESLSDEAKIVFLYYIEQLALEGDKSLLQFHIEYVNKNYVKQPVLKKIQVENSLQQRYNINIKSGSSIAQELAALNLPTAVKYGLLAFASALSVPVGDIVDLVIALGLVVIVAWHWDDIDGKWGSIVNIFAREFGSRVRNAFDYLAARAQGLPTNDEFSKFDKHYDDHAHEFVNKLGGNVRLGNSVKSGTKMVKFNTSTLEFMIYCRHTKHIYSYFLPKWSEKNIKNVPMWTIKAFNHFWLNIRR